MRSNDTLYEKVAIIETKIENLTESQLKQSKKLDDISSILSSVLATHTEKLKTIEENRIPELSLRIEEGNKKTWGIVFGIITLTLIGILSTIFLNTT